MFELPLIRVIIAIVGGFRAFYLDPTTGHMVPHVGGAADGPAPEEWSVPDSFEGMDEAALRDLHTKIEERFQAEKEDAGSTKTGVDKLRAYRKAQTDIVTEINRQVAERKEIADAVAELETPAPLPDPEDPEAPEEPAESAEPAPGDPAAPAAPEATATTPTPQAVAAGLTAADIAAGRTQQTRTEQAPAAKARPKAAMTAAASQQVVPFGTEVDLAKIGEIVQDVKSKLKPRGEQVKAFVASLDAYEDVAGLGVELLKKDNATSHNDRLIRESVEAHMARRDERMGRVARTAAICDPLDIIREIPDYVSQADPLSGVFPSRPIGRLGFQFTPAIALSAVSGGVRGTWDETDQADVDPTDPDTWKPCFDVTCPSPCDIIAIASTACMRFDVTTDMSNPERVRDVMSKLTALRIRNRTIRLLDTIDDLSLQFTRTGDYSLFPDTVYAINDLITRMSYGERLDAEDYTLLLAPGFPDYLVSDIFGKEFQSSEEYSEGETSVMRRLSAACGGIEVVELRDETDSLYPALPAIATPTVLSDNPCAWPLRLIHTPSAIYGSTGVIDTGIQSDPQLARMNKREWFQEEYTLLTKHGSPPWAKLTLTSAASGSRAAASTKLACG